MTYLEKLLLDKLQASRQEIGIYKGILASHGIQVDSSDIITGESPKVKIKESNIIKHNFRRAN